MGVKVQTDKGEKVLPLPSEIAKRIEDSLAAYVPRTGGVFTGEIKIPAKTSFVLTDLRSDIPATEGQLQDLLSHIKNNAHFNGVDVYSGDNSAAKIDFHFGDASDATSSIKETAEGKLELLAPNGVIVNGEPVGKHNHDGVYVKPQDVQTEIAKVVGTAPIGLDTLGEIAQSIGNNIAFAAAMETELAGKVDKVAGKQLSTEDFTTAEKQKIAALGALSEKSIVSTDELDEVLKSAIAKAIAAYPQQSDGIPKSDLAKSVRDSLDKADTAIQSLSGYVKDVDLQSEVTRSTQADLAATARLDAIEEKVPVQASATNQLADKDFVNSSINSAAAFFRGNFTSKAAFDDYAGPATNNDYVYIQSDETHNNEAWRYIYVDDGESEPGWQPQFRVNEAPFTDAQSKAINSGITDVLVSKLNGLSNYTHPTSHPADMITGLHLVATSGSYTDLLDKPTIPEEYVLPEASAVALGGIKVGYLQTGKNYPMLLDDEGKAYVNVPWENTDTDTTYTADEETISLSGTEFSLKSGVMTPGSYGPTLAETQGDDGATVRIPYITVDTYGRVTKIKEQLLVNKNTTYSDATQSASGLMSAADKTKLAGIDEGANNYIHPDTHPADIITGLADVATSGSYEDLSDTPHIRTLTTSSVRIWDLEPGIYVWEYSGAKTLYYYGQTSTNSITLSNSNGTVNLVVGSYSTTYKSWILFDVTSSGGRTVRHGYTSASIGYNYSFTMPTSTPLTSISSYVQNNLTYSTSNTTYALSAYQGYLLNNRLTALESSGGGDVDDGDVA